MVELAPLHTFALNYKAARLFEFARTTDVVEAAKNNGLFSHNHYLLGVGSNTLFCQDFNGSIIRYTDDSLTITEDQDYYYLKVGAGFNWHKLVEHTVTKGIYGLENLALIPGLVGAAPIQNIGAYGVELGQFVDYVEYLDKSTLKLEKLKGDECNWGYRDSIFKGELAGKVIITTVGLKLAKKWQANNGYAGVQGLTDAKQIFTAVVDIRNSKLPNPSVLPNAGSFFKNPIISEHHFTQLKTQFTDMPSFSAKGNDVKVPAAWLIDYCGFKGFNLGGVGVYAKHGLVLVNHSAGNGDDLLALVKRIREQVKLSFAIDLEIEVRLIGASGLLKLI